MAGAYLSALLVQDPLVTCTQADAELVQDLGPERSYFPSSLVVQSTSSGFHAKKDPAANGSG